MDRKSIVAFIIIYALVASIGFIASNRHDETPTAPSAETEETEALIVEGESLDTRIAITR